MYNNVSYTVIKIFFISKNIKINLCDKNSTLTFLCLANLIANFSNIPLFSCNRPLLFILKVFEALN